MMKAYLEITKKFISDFEDVRIHQLVREQNKHADALASLASAIETGKQRTINIETIQVPSIERSMEVGEIVELSPS